ncbi:MAG: beta-eliminating lyase-related protein [Candidatus Hydrothermae bacterium]|nr:beta-eliminating lyase-related protein [Candidatus Hydrothermae bacterium]
MPLLHIYKASAGSGKTYRLVQNYIAYVLQPGHRFDEVLAITFTNKAAAEMKERILSTLHDLASTPPDNAYIHQLQHIYRERGQSVPSAEEISNRAKELLQDILHNYSRFSVSTIDSFFQNLLRSFARELNISVNYNLELDRESLLQEVVDRLVDLAGSKGHEGLTRWLLDFMKDRISNDKSWDPSADLLSFSHHLFDDEFLAISADPESPEAPSERLMKVIESLLKSLNNIIYSFENQMDEWGRQGLECLRKHGVEYNDFSGGKGSAMNYFNKIRKEKARGNIKNYEVGSSLRKSLDGEKSFIAKSSIMKEQLQTALDGGALNILEKAAKYSEQHLTRYRSAVLVKRHLFQLGILGEMNRLLADIRKERNILLIDDTERLLRGVIEGNDTPFIYEKTGSRYRFFLIDEFQDTSDKQWNNLFPLLANALDEGDEVLTEARSHILNFESGHPVVFSRVMVRPLPSKGGEIPLKVLEEAMNKRRNIHVPQPTLLTLENTHNFWSGRILSPEYMKEAYQLAHRYGLHVHLDGARIWNPAAALGVPETTFTQHTDTVMACFSKGLGAPVGSILAGPVEKIEEARAYRKMLGGGMRQAGIIAAGALHALEHHRERLVEDHQRASRIAEELAQFPHIRVDLASIQTNIVFADLEPPYRSTDFVNFLQEKGVGILATGPRTVRMVTHLDVDDEDVDRLLMDVKAFFKEQMM